MKNFQHGIFPIYGIKEKLKAPTEPIVVSQPPGNNNTIPATATVSSSPADIIVTNTVHVGCFISQNNYTHYYCRSPMGV